MATSDLQFKIFVDPEDRVSPSHTDVSQETKVQDTSIVKAWPAGVSMSDNISQLALLVKKLSLGEQCPNARIAVAPSGPSCSRPYKAPNFWYELPNSWSIRETSKTSSLVIKHDGIECKCLFHPHNNGVTIVNLDDEILECTPLVNCVPDLEGRTCISQGESEELEMGPWRISNEDQSWVDVYVFERTFDVSERVMNGDATGAIKIQPRLSPLSEQIEDRKADSYELSCLSTNWSMNSVRLAKGKHSNHGLVAVKQLQVSEESSTLHVTKLLERGVGVLTRNNSRRNGPHPSIVKLVGFDFRLHAIYTEFTYPILLAQKNSDGYFVGDQKVFLDILTHIPPGLKCVHDEWGLTHYNISSATIVYKPTSGRYVIDGFEACSSEDENADIFGASGYTAPELTRLIEDGMARRLLKPFLPRSDVYALAVVLLYVRGLLPLPEEQAWARPRTTKDALRCKKYVQQTTKWGRRVQEIANKFSPSPKNVLLKRMLNLNPKGRLSSHDLLLRSQYLLT